MWKRKPPRPMMGTDFHCLDDLEEGMVVEEWEDAVLGIV